MQTLPFHKTEGKTTQTIYNSDCLELMKTFPDKSFDLVLTDPPYGMSYQSSWRTDKHEMIAFDDGKDIGWLIPFLKESYRLLKDDRHMYIFCNDYLFSEFFKWVEPCGFTMKRTLVWVKNNHTSGDLEGDYGNKTEWVIFLHKGRRALNGKRETNVLNFDRVNTNSHPTEKPAKLLQFLISKSTSEGESILDPFAGSGSTITAAKYLNRNATGIEISEKYCEIARNRLAQQSLF